MREIKLGKHVLEVYDSIEELPVVRHHRFNKLMLVDAQVGADIESFDAHIERVLQYISKDKKEFAKKELMTLRQNVYFIQSEVSPRNLAFAVLVKKMDGKEMNDLSEGSLKKITEKLSFVTEKEMRETVDSIKKKLDSELGTYFPALFDNAETKEYYTQLRQRTLLIISQILGEAKEGDEERIKQLTGDLVIFSDPIDVTGEEALEVKQDKQFNNACFLMSQNIGADPKKFTVLEYYSALFFIEKQTKASKIKSKK